MFVRVKPAGNYRYLQIAENHREGRKVKQRILCTLGRVDELTESGKLDGLAQSLLRFSDRLKVIERYGEGSIRAISDVSIGPEMVFGRLWQELGIGEVIASLVSDRHFGFDLERAIFLTVLHRLMDPGSDRAAEKWKADFRIPGAEGIELHQLYRTMGWLGEEVAGAVRGRQKDVHLGVRTNKDRIEELLFARRRDLFSSLQVLFFDTTSIYFEGQGGESLGQWGHSKDHRPDLRQMIVGAALDQQGRAVCCELFPGNATDVKLLFPAIKGIQARFEAGCFCLVADRGMIRAKTVAALEAPGSGIDYILGCRMRSQKEVREKVLGAPGGHYKEVQFDRAGEKDPLVLKVREVKVQGRRYIVCYNPEQAKKDAADRQAIVQSLRERLKQGDKALVGNKGYRRYLSSPPASAGFTIDEQKLKEEARYDGKWVLRTNTTYSAEEVAFQYKQLWMVEQAFRAVKSVLETRPIYHKCDDTIRGHVFCSFLALILMKELLSRIQASGKRLEWADVKRDLTGLREVQILLEGDRYYLRTELPGCCFDVLQAAGVAVPPTLRR
jgi:hypothetical protein